MAKTRRPMPPFSAELRSRPPLERMLRIHEILREGRAPSVADLARRLEVSGKTVQRDVEFMRERLKLPVVHSRAHGGYRYTEPVTGFPSLQVTEGEAVALATPAAKYGFRYVDRCAGSRKPVHALQGQPNHWGGIPLIPRLPSPANEVSGGKQQLQISKSKLRKPYELKPS